MQVLVLVLAVICTVAAIADRETVEEKVSGCGPGPPLVRIGSAVLFWGACIYIW